MIRAVQNDDTRRAASTSLANRSSEPSPTKSPCSVLTATRFPSGSYASYTTPCPPAPSRPASQ